ncbi:hypothetical protein Bbelb_317520 [Branchiostoma belcheri]|nr:hypothetical protein Bbelb_317520 [Branchiostoma belcheri]
MSSQTLSEPHWATPPNILPRQDVHRCRQKVVRDKDETSNIYIYIYMIRDKVPHGTSRPGKGGAAGVAGGETPEMNIIQHGLVARTITPAAVHGKVVHDENQLFITAFNILVCPCKESADEADVPAVCWLVRRQKGPRDSADPRSQILLEKFTAGGMSEAQQSAGKADCRGKTVISFLAAPSKCRQSVCASWSAGVPQARNAADISSSQSSTDAAESVPENFGNFLPQDTTTCEAVVDKHEGHERRSCARRRGYEKAGGDGDLDLGLGIPTWIGATVVPYSTTAEQQKEELAVLVVIIVHVVQKGVGSKLVSSMDAKVCNTNDMLSTNIIHMGGGVPEALTPACCSILVPGVLLWVALHPKYSGSRPVSSRPAKQLYPRNTIQQGVCQGSLTVVKRGSCFLGKVAWRAETKPGATRYTGTMATAALSTVLTRLSSKIAARKL